MAELKIYLCRHGESAGNVDGILGGDSDLTTRGKDHAKNTASFLADKQIEIVYFSPLKRSVQTAEIVREYIPSAKFIAQPALIEIDYGCLDNLTIDEIRRRFPKEVKERRKDKYSWKLLDGESYEDVDKRIQPFIEELKKKAGVYGIIAHRAVNKIILRRFHLSLESVLNRDIPHDCIFQITYSEQNPFRGAIQQFISLDPEDSKI